MRPLGVMGTLAAFVSIIVLFQPGQCFAQSEMTFPVTGVFTGCSQGEFSSGRVITQCSKAAAGVGIGYRHWWAHEGASISFERSATSSKLIDPPAHRFFEWPIDRNELDLMFLHRFPMPLRWRVSPDVRAGVAAIVLDGGKWSGLDRQCAAVVGGGAHIRLSPRFSIEAGTNYESLYASTYGDQTYRSRPTHMWEPSVTLVAILGSTNRRW